MSDAGGIVCWHNGYPMHARSARILRNQLFVIEEGERVAVWEAMAELEQNEWCDEHRVMYRYACPLCQKRRYAQSGWTGEPR